MRGGALGAVLGAWVGLAALTPGGIAAAQGQPEAEIKKAFETLAAELVANGLDKELGLRNYARPLRVAVWPFGRRDPVALNVAERYHREFVAALQEKAGRRVAIYGPDQILKVESIRRELGASDDLTLVGNPYAALAGSIDVLIEGAMQQKGEDDVTVSYRALDMKDELRRQIAATGAQLIKGALREARAATPFDEAMKEAARQFRDQAPDMHTVELAGVTYQATGSRTELSDYLEKGALKALVEAYASRVSGRALAVRPAEFRPDAAAKQGLDTGRTLPAGEGAYVLSGDYWDHGGSFEVRLSLTGYDGRSVPWSDHVQKATLPQNLRTRPSGDFGALGDNVKGPIRF
ncbi:MAG: hypothetical protein FJX61_18170, partial [Alphaproteobacteria bacterium]|nr:hypothetical protein [Alphaproteobacteria bacterium]